MTARPRIPLLEVEAARAAAAEAGISDLAVDLNVFRALLHHPHLARRLWDLLMGLLWESRLEARLRELVIMRLGWVTASDYEWTQHWRIALQLKVPEEDLLAVRDWTGHPGFGPADRAVLLATDETLADGAIAPSTWQACVEHVSDDPQVLLELVASIGLWRMISGLLLSLEVPLENGVVSWPPDGSVPPAASTRAVR